MREANLSELAWAWQDCSPRAKLEALVGQRALLEEVAPGMHAHVKAQLQELLDADKASEQAERKAALEAAKAAKEAEKEAKRAARLADQEARRIERKRPIEIGRIERALKGAAYRDGIQQKKVENTRQKLAKAIEKNSKDTTAMRRGSGLYRDEPITAVADPPVALESVTPSAGPSGSEATTGAGAPVRPSAFERSMWQQLVDPAEGGWDTMGDMLQALEASSEFRSAAVLEALRRCRLALSRCSPEASPADLVRVRIGDVLVVAQALSGRLR